MATKYVWSGATGAADGTSWTDAYLTLAAAEAGGWVGGVGSADLILVADDHAESTAGSITTTMPTAPGMRMVCVNRGTGLQSTGATVSVTGTASNNLVGYGYVEGITFQSSSTGGSSNTLSVGGSTTASSIYARKCKWIMRHANTQANIFLGQTAQTTNDDVFVRLEECTVKFGATAQSLVFRHGRMELINLILDGTGSAPTNLFSTRNSVNSTADITASDLSNLSWTTLLNADGTGCGHFRVTQCKFPSGWSAYSVSGGAAGGPELYIVDCATGDTNLDFGYYCPQGNVTLDTATYFTGSAAGNKSWKVLAVGAITGPTQPFVTPWLDFYLPLATVTPRLECLRNDGTASAFNDNEVYVEVLAKTTSGTPKSTFYTDRGPVLSAGTAQAAGAGTGSWTIGTPTSPYSFKCDTGSSITPAEAGDIRMRICVSNGISINVDPVVRTA